MLSFVRPRLRALTRRPRFGVAIAAFAAICAAVTIAPAPAGATSKTDSYTGPVDQPRADSFFDPPTVELKVKSKDRKGNRKFRPKLMSRFRLQTVSYVCSDGQRYPSGEGTAEARFKWDLPGFKIKHRKFSASDSLGGPFHEETIEVTGTIPKNGPASGTFHVSGRIFPLPDEGFPGVEGCDSGLVTWTADKQ